MYSRGDRARGGRVAAAAAARHRQVPAARHPPQRSGIPPRPLTPARRPQSAYRLPQPGAAFLAAALGQRPSAPDPAGAAGDRRGRAPVALEILRLADNPARRRDLLTESHATVTLEGPRGRRLAAGDHRIETGAVTERLVASAAKAGQRLVLGPRAVLTPLARDRALALGVPIERER